MPALPPAPALPADPASELEEDSVSSTESLQEDQGSTSGAFTPGAAPSDESPPDSPTITARLRTQRQQELADRRALMFSSSVNGWCWSQSSARELGHGPSPILTSEGGKVGRPRGTDLVEEMNFHKMPMKLNLSRGDLLET
ncbi:UNVERIFIED_CONTAM: hypothetical protein K2H54_057490 [Gekko kuhli]